jgi:predicted nucleotidyltransferase
VPGPTAFPDLNGVLAELVEGARSVLGENFCGAYLHGSFATGEADAYSDVDFMVVTFCRLLFTFSEGRVPSKREAGEWALATLDEEWRDLVQQALDDRADPWERVHQPAAADIAKRTLRFAEYAAATATRWAGSGAKQALAEVKFRDGLGLPIDRCPPHRRRMQ